MSTCLPSAVILPTGEDERVLYSVKCCLDFIMFQTISLGFRSHFLHKLQLGPGRAYPDFTLNVCVGYVVLECNILSKNVMSIPLCPFFL